jgi:gamma-glutamyltranspeptidase/glutathione hydrolase
VSLIQSIYSAFGSGVVVPGTGIVLQNRGSSFSLDPAHPNVIAPGKRPFHTLTPAMALRGGRPWLVFGTMGGSLQPQVHLQVLTNVVDFGMDAQQALDAPRWAVGGLAHDDVAPDLNLEAPLADAAAARLEALGHRVVRHPAWSDDFGHAHAIRGHQESGVLEAGADPRSDGAAVGW